MALVQVGVLWMRYFTNMIGKHMAVKNVTVKHLKNRKRSNATIVVPLALGGLMAFSAFAASELTLVDTNGDGIISAAEITAAQELKRTEMITQFDTDGDGELSKEERMAARELRKSERLQAYDADGDGELSRAERLAARESRRDAVEAQLDVNGDGVVSDEEGAGFDEVRKQRREERGERGGKRGGKNADRGARNDQ